MPLDGVHEEKEDEEPLNEKLKKERENYKKQNPKEYASQQKTEPVK